MSGLARVGLAGALLVLGTGVGQATVSRSAPGAAVPSAPVVRATAVCPDGPVTVGSVGTGPGGLTARPLADAAAPLPVDAAGEAVAGVRAPVLTATGAVAGGLAAEHVTRLDDGPVRGLTAVRCTAPTTSAWLVGGATVVGQTAELVLVNADDAPAVVDVQTWSATGPVSPRPGRGLAVPGRSRVTVAVDRLAPDRDLLALHVTASRGRVAPYLRSVRFDGRTPRGVDWVPAGLPPARDVVVPGLPSGPGRRTLVVTNPGPDDTVVSVELTTADGQLAAFDLDVPAQTSVAREVSRELEATPAAARIRSADAPVLAAAFVYDLQSGLVRELSWSASSAPVTGPALLADVALSAPAEQTLLLTALERDAVVELVPVPVLRVDGRGPEGTPPAPQRVAVPAGTTVPVALSTFARPGARARLALALRPVEGQVHAARYLRERGRTGPLTAVLPVVQATATVPRPRVARDPLAGS